MVFDFIGKFFISTAKVLIFADKDDGRLFSLFRVFPLHNLIRVLRQLLEQRCVNVLQVDADPVFGVEVVVRGLHTISSVEQFGDAFRLALHHHSELVEVAVAEGVAADVKHQQGIAAGHLREGQFLLHLAQRQAKLAVFFNVHHT